VQPSAQGRCGPWWLELGARSGTAHRQGALAKARLQFDISRRARASRFPRGPLAPPPPAPPPAPVRRGLGPLADRGQARQALLLTFDGGFKLDTATVVAEAAVTGSRAQGGTASEAALLSELQVPEWQELAVLNRRPAEVGKYVKGRRYSSVLLAQEVGLFAQRYHVDQPRAQTEGQGNCSGDGLHHKQAQVDPGPGPRAQGGGRGAASQQRCRPHQRAPLAQHGARITQGSPSPSHTYCLPIPPPTRPTPFPCNAHLARGFPREAKRGQRARGETGAR
jgi:hypothetical protein